MTQEAQPCSRSSTPTRRTSICSAQSQSDYSISSLECEESNPNAVATTFKGFENEKQICTVTVIGGTTHIGTVYNNFHNEISEKKVNENKTEEAQETLLCDINPKPASNAQNSALKKVAKVASFVATILLVVSAVKVIYPASLMNSKNNNEWTGNVKVDTVILRSQRRISEQIYIVIISHTGGRSCFTTKQCKRRIDSLKNGGFEKKQDSSVNFLIGGNGEIYESKGWNEENPSPAINIAFIGNFTQEKVPAKMFDRLERFLNFESQNRHIDKEFIVVGENQLLNFTTDSPGSNLYTKIKSLDWWFNE